MTEATTENARYDFSTDPHGLTREDILGADFYLDEILRMSFGDFNEGDHAIQLTLTIDGLLVSGVAISSAAWNTRMAQTLSTGGDKFGKAFEEVAVDMASRSRAILESRISEERPLPAHRYVHLRDVRIGSGGATQFVPLWRARISKVSGWTVGSTNTAEEAANNA